MVMGSLPARIGGEDDTVPAHSVWPAGPYQDLRDADPGHVSGGHQARQQPQPAVRAAPAGRVEHTPRLELGPRLGGHEHAQAGQPVGHIRRDRVRHDQPLTPEPILTVTKCRWNSTNNTTAGRASTNDPAMIAPYGFVATPDDVLM